MHRSGTSMVAKLLHGCGLYLGEAADLAEPGTHNPDGYWENLRFVEINDELLNGAGGGWDQVPPELATGAGNQRRDHHRRLRARAKALLGRFPQGAPWGWKDPRNSLTFPFWDDLCPGLRTVMCVRNPLEVALSLRRRNDFSYAHGLTLWAEYNRRLLESSSRERRLVTHYDAFFRDPEAEVRRLAEFAGLSPPEEVVRSTVAAVRSELRHNRFSAADLLDA